jgi:hypothetical protein
LKAEASCGRRRERVTKDVPMPIEKATHHAPSAESVHSRYAGSPLNPAFASNLEDLIEQYKPEL